MADHPPLVNPIVIRALSVPQAEDYCGDGVYGIRLYFNDERFLNDPLGAWAFKGANGFLSLEPDDGTPRFQSQVDEYRERKTDVEYCIQEHFSVEEVVLDITLWDWTSFEATYDSILEDGSTATGSLSGLWRDDINDCD